jgi:hypothetical protein
MEANEDFINENKFQCDNYDKDVVQYIPSTDAYYNPALISFLSNIHLQFIQTAISHDLLQGFENM